MAAGISARMMIARVHRNLIRSAPHNPAAHGGSAAAEHLHRQPSRRHVDLHRRTTPQPVSMPMHTTLQHTRATQAMHRSHRNP